MGGKEPLLQSTVSSLHCSCETVTGEDPSSHPPTVSGSAAFKGRGKMGDRDFVKIIELHNFIVFIIIPS